MKQWLKYSAFGIGLLLTGFIAGTFCQPRSPPVIIPPAASVSYPVLSIRDIERTCPEVQEVTQYSGPGGSGKVAQVKLVCTGNGYETRWYIDVDKQTAVGVSYPVLVGRYP